MTLPQADALARFWASVPPPAVQLKRIALFLGLPDTKPESRRPAQSSEEEILREAAAMGLPVIMGRPDDPLLDLIGL